MRTKEQEALRMYVRAREDFQAMRKRMDNRLGRKADGSQQNIQDGRNFSLEDVHNFVSISDNARHMEKEVEKMLKTILEKFPVYDHWLKNVKGVGTVAAGWLLGEFNIREATTVSKMWQYAGLNPGLVPGKKRISSDKYKPEMGEILKEISNQKKKSVDYLVLTNEMIRGDKATEGFVLPFNKNLRTHLLGVMADNFIKGQNHYAIEFYYPQKNRLENSDNIVKNVGKPRKDDGKAWKDVSKGHRHNAAKRWMIKWFLRDLYEAWRECEGLPVRPPYGEEYLGKNPHNKKTG